MGMPSRGKPLRHKERRNALRSVWRIWKGGCFVTETLRLTITRQAHEYRTDVRRPETDCRGAAIALPGVADGNGRGYPIRGIEVRDGA